MTTTILTGDCVGVLRTLPAGTFQTCLTSPPYLGLRDYGAAGQIGMEAAPTEYVEKLVAVFAEVRRVLREDGTLWLNLGSSYASKSFAPWGIKPKDDLCIPHRVAFALQADGWTLRSCIIWHKPNPMPESVTDRPTSAHEHVFLMTKGPRYFYDAGAIAEEGVVPAGSKRSKSPERATAMGRKASGNELIGFNVCSGTRNARNVWTIATQPYSGAHFATMPPELAERCIKAGSAPKDHVLDPFGGAGTTALVADRLNRHSTIIELNPAFAQLAHDRIREDAGMLAEIA